ncbi:MFS transporter [Gryllotalpicola ginsengisoli]|uniref:MFS transporter n=1 Tax=Gryllotalpicola ginsengisoli TaxID=444608 RepID=UPI0004875790|nr:MFS transporter [Gryllotalpicola ginsengisoli]
MSLATELNTSLGRSISNTLKGSAGNLVEWYDVYVYSTFASYFEDKFFDPADKNSTIYVWATFAVTFLMRPVGSWFFGRYADRYGRRAALTLSVSIMALCSIAVAVMPTRSVFGVGAAVLLILARLVQGFATGGEYGTSATYMSEAAWHGKRGFLSSFQYVTLVGGQVIAQLVLLIMLLTMGHDAIAAWGWRVAFAIGGVAAIVVFWIRRTMDESLSSADIHAAKTGVLEAKTHGSIVELFGRYWREVLLVIFITMGGTLTFYIYTVVGPSIVAGSVGASSPVLASTISLIALAIYMCLQPLGGWLADIVGYKSQLVFYGVGAFVFTWVFVLVLPKANGFAAFGLLIVAFLIETAYTSISAIVKAQVFPAHVRAIGVGIAYAVANSLFGGTAPLIYAAFTGANNVAGFIIYAMIVIAASLVTYLFFLHNKGANWLDDPEEMLRRRQARSGSLAA